MHRIIEWFTRNGVAANILMVALVSSGIYSGLNKIVLQEFPDYPSRTITVDVQYRGSTPTEIEESIVLRLEENLFDVEGVDEMDARASSNSGSVSLTISDNYDINRALDEVKNRVDTIRTFPIEAERPRITLRNFEERVITVVIAGDLSEGEMKHLGETIRDELNGIEGISLTTLKAVRPYEIAIEVPEATLRSTGSALIQSSEQCGIIRSTYPREALRRKGATSCCGHHNRPTPKPILTRFLLS